MKRRIIRADAHNWAIQEWQEGGETVERGRYAGQEKQSKWKNPEKFYHKLEDAAGEMFREIVADNWNLTGQALLGMIQDAQKQVAEHVSSLVANMETDTMIGVLQGRGWVVTSGKKGRASYTDDPGEEPKGE